ncbi:MAG TPA: nitrile hydratase [Stellaceae bacterium]|nr:nitrile hydratase [Stellaceae bacterium]
MRSHHDMGGQPAGPVARTEHDYAFWEKRVDALMVLLSSPKHRLLNVDELRRNIEALPPDAYDRMSYYERWISAICNTLLQRGAITTDELARKMTEIEAREGAA